MMSKRTNLLQGLAVIGCAVVAACATTTPYQPADPSGRGFSEQRLESDRYRISFGGNTMTSRDTVENYLLYRAAELTVQNGYDHFIIVEGAVDEQTSFRTYSTGVYGSYGYAYPYTVYGLHARRHFGFYGAYGPYGPDAYTTRQQSEFTATADVIMRSGEKPADNPQAYNAREVLTNLSTSIVRPVR